MGKPVRLGERINHHLYPINALVLGDQGTDHQATRTILPERKMGASPIDGGAGNCATSATHAGRQAGRETGIGDTRTCARSHRPTLE